MSKRFAFVLMALMACVAFCCAAGKPEKPNYCETTEDMSGCPQYLPPENCEKIQFLKDTTKPFPGCCPYLKCLEYKST